MAERKSYEKQQNLADILNVASRMLESKDPYTTSHQQRVVKLSTAIAEKLGLPRKREMLKLAARVHDVGKIAIPMEVLVKPARLSDQTAMRLLSKRLSSSTRLRTATWCLS